VDQFLAAVAKINSSYANVLLLLVAIGSLSYAFREYALKRRPVVVPEIQSEVVGEDWRLSLRLVNLGMTPAHAKIETAILRIGDEQYPTVFAQSILLAGASSASSKVVVAPIGHINANGRRRILGHEYRSNRCEIEISLISKAIGARRFSFKSQFIYQVLVDGAAPVFALVKEHFA
jgi:hypothetical protein